MSLPPKKSNSNKCTGVSFTVGTEAADVINVGLVAQYWNGSICDRRMALPWYLSAAADGGDLAAAPSGGMAIGTNGVLIEEIAGRSGVVVTNANGRADINITEAGGVTRYLVIVLPTADLVVSPAITFAV